MRRVLIALALVCIGSSAFSETTSFGYDVFGRLVGTGRFEGALDGIRDDVEMDQSDNRVTYYVRDVRYVINAGSSLFSSDGRTELRMQSDGNLVVLFQGMAQWSTNTAGSAANRAVMQSAGNLVLYSAGNQAIWSSSLGGQYGALLAIQNDGNVVIYDVSRTAIWSTGTGGHPPA